MSWYIMSTIMYHYINSRFHQTKKKKTLNIQEVDVQRAQTESTTLRHTEINETHQNRERSHPRGAIFPIPEANPCRGNALTLSPYNLYVNCKSGMFRRPFGCGLYLPVSQGQLSPGRRDNRSGPSRHSTWRGRRITLLARLSPCVSNSQPC